MKEKTSGTWENLPAEHVGGAIEFNSQKLMFFHQVLIQNSSFYKYLTSYDAKQKNPTKKHKIRNFEESDMGKIVKEDIRSRRLDVG